MEIGVFLVGLKIPSHKSFVQAPDRIICISVSNNFKLLSYKNTYYLKAFAHFNLYDSWDNGHLGFFSETALKYLAKNSISIINANSKLVLKKRFYYVHLGKTFFSVPGGSPSPPISESHMVVPAVAEGCSLSISDRGSVGLDCPWAPDFTACTA